MRNLFLLIILIIFLLILGCSEDGPTEPEKNYTGITETPETGPTPIGEIDPDDWYLECDDIMGSGGDYGGGGIPRCYTVLPAYPNPTNRQAKLEFSLPISDSVKIWLDDPMSNKETILVNDKFAAGFHRISIDLFYGDDSNNRIEGIVRVFVNFVASDIPLIHGDIQIIE